MWTEFNRYVNWAQQVKKPTSASSTAPGFPLLSFMASSTAAQMTGKRSIEILLEIKMVATVTYNKKVVKVIINYDENENCHSKQEITTKSKIHQRNQQSKIISSTKKLKKNMDKYAN